MPPPVIKFSRRSGTGLARSTAPVAALRTVQSASETSAIWPSSKAVCTPGHSSARKPKLTALRKKRPLIDSATRQPSPRLRSDRAAGRLDPVPKFLPPTMMSPGAIWSTQPGRFAENTARACSASVAVNSGPGSIRSVLMSSPNFQTRPIVIAPSSDRVGVRDMAGHGRGGDRGGRCHVDAGGLVAHAAAEIARAGGDAGLAGADHAHVPAVAGAAGRRGHHGAGLEQGLRVAGLRRGGRDALR